MLAGLTFLLAGRFGPSVFRFHKRPLPPTTYVTADGQRATIKLADGSSVALNVGSKLDVPMDFAQGNRTLHLDGEALFTVVHHDDAPFTVVTNNARTRVLGTSFVVRQYETDSVATVAVRDGKVAVQSVVVTALHQATVRSNGATQVGRANAGIFTFANGILTLDGVPLPEAIPELNRWYKADIRLADSSLAEHRIKATCATGTITDLAGVLELALDVRAVRNGRTLTLYPR
jgi:ferric-dicitrate binding protein FerR (iron transport regulator)